MKGGTAMHIGVVLPQVGVDWDDVLDAAQHAEATGADSVWVIDHVLGFPPPAGILEAWTVLSAPAGGSGRAPGRAPGPFRALHNPALFAKMAAALSPVSRRAPCGP